MEEPIKGGEFLIKSISPQSIFIPEDFDEEAKLMAQSCKEFLAQEVFPKVDAIDSQADPALMPSILKKAGELGLLSTSIPVEYGGLALPFTSTMLVTEEIGRGFSFAVSLSAHTGIGTLPILYYGNAEQKTKYLPRLGTGEILAAYCLTEPNAGSDANSGKTKAVLNEAGTHYLITGQKMWITNGGFADIFIVFAKIDNDENHSAFIVEKDFGNITMNPEEHKLGIKGSSTRQIFFNETPVPVSNLLSSRGNGFKIAVNILNIGRIKLAAAAYGICKQTLGFAVGYANERKQFDKSIGEFGAIRHKIAEMGVRTFASEAATFRAAEDIELKIASLEKDGISTEEAKLKGTEQFAIECALMKVHASETLDFVVDEGLQIYGGMGYSAEAPMERAYRDARINRIFEGTNEINRMLAVGMLLKRAMKGELNIMKHAIAISQELTAMPSINTETGFLSRESAAVANLKKSFILIAAAAFQKFKATIDDQQEILMSLADILIETYVAESALLRARKIAGTKPELESILEAIVQVYLDLAISKTQQAGYTAINAFAIADEQKMLSLGLKRYTKVSAVNTVAARQLIAIWLLSGKVLSF